MLGIVEELKIEILVILFSMLPLVELRGAIPLGISLGLSPLRSGVISILGNILAVIILLKFLNPLMSHFERTRIFSSTIGKIKKRSMKKSKIIKKYSLIGLFIFVSIPFPTTGAWTGSLIALILKLDIKKSFIVMALGLIVSGIITLSISYKIFDLL